MSGTPLAGLPDAAAGSAAGDESASHVSGCCCPGCALPSAEALAAAAAETSTAAAVIPLADTFRLHSLPGATKVIYLDFNGHTTSGTSWNSTYAGGSAFTTAAYSFEGDASFSDAELERIQRIWQRVAEDYAPFGIDVTTQDPGLEALRKAGSGDTRWGVRVVVGGDGANWYAGAAGGGAGGVAYVGSFAWDSDTPCYVFEDNLGNGNEKYTAEAISHEAGHTFGLSHDGTGSTGYYQGHGAGETGWAPVMGNGYYQELTQWSKGQYPGADELQDDLAVIASSANGVTYRADDHGNTTATATFVSWVGTGLSASGLIGRSTDYDVFAFDLATAGTLTLDVSPAALGANLDVLAQLYNAAGTLIASSNPLASLGASFDRLLSAGRYYLRVDGTGKAASGSDPGYSDYGSLGTYTVVGNFAPSITTPAVTLAVSPASVTEDGAGAIAYKFVRTGDLSRSLTVTFAVRGTATYGTDYAVRGAASFSGTAGTVTFAAGAASATVTIDPTADGIAEAAETIILALADGAAYNLGTAAAATGTIANDDAPAVVSGLTATAESSSQIDLSWSTVAGATGYKIERSANGGATWAHVDAVSAATFSDTGLSAGTAYSYRVRATNAVGDGSYSAVATATTLKPASSSSAARRFDFGTADSPLASGYARVTEATRYSTSRGYGWAAGTVLARDRGAGTALNRDLHLSEDATFGVDLPDGDYRVTVTFGDAGYARDLIGVSLEDVLVDTVSTAKGQFVTRTYAVKVSDGRLGLRLDDLGGKDPYAVINALQIDAVAPPAARRFDFGTADSPLASGYARVTEATRYSTSRGYGWAAGTVLARDRGAGTALNRDLHLSEDATFGVDLPDGDYRVTVTFGDAGYARDLIGVSLEDVLVDTVSTAKGQFVTRTYAVKVSDGRLGLRLDDLGGKDPYAVINALQIDAVAAAPVAEAGPAVVAIEPVGTDLETKPSAPAGPETVRAVASGASIRTDSGAPATVSIPIALKITKRLTAAAVGATGGGASGPGATSPSVAGGLVSALGMLAAAAEPAVPADDAFEPRTPSGDGGEALMNFAHSRTPSRALEAVFSELAETPFDLLVG